MPEEAFFLMKRDTILDWKANQAVSKSKSSVTSEKPGGGETEHKPSESKPKNEAELRQAALDALSSSDE